jgi:nucleoside-diphosphate-sugar epimerase
MLGNVRDDAAVRVLLTGSTGFVGSFTVPALLARGHDVRVLVRDPAKAESVLARRGVDVGAPRIEVAVGDMLDAAAVERAIDGCDAAVHAAAAIGITSGGAVSVHEQNVAGTAHVVGGAVAAGLDPVVHVSTIAVFVPPHAPVITTTAPLASPRNEYGRSKVEAERTVRRLQADGAPIAVVYPGGVLGPDQPHLDATLEGIAGARRSGWPITPGGVCLVDVRDLAEILAAAVVPGQGPRRLLAGGHFLTWPALGDLTDRITGVRARRIRFPRAVLLAAGSALDVLRKIRTIAYPLTRDAAEIMVTTVPTDDGPSLASLGITLRPVEETVEDALRWLAKEGHIPPFRS